MTALIVAIVAVCGFMAAQDFLGTGLSISTPRGLRFWPGFFDGLGDFPGKYGGAVVAVTAVKFSLWGWQTLLVVSACALTSFISSNKATGFLKQKLPDNEAQQHPSHWRRLAKR